MTIENLALSAIFPRRFSREVNGVGRRYEARRAASFARSGCFIMGSTHGKAPAGFAPIAIGLGLTLIHLVSIPVTNTSVNPCSPGPAHWVPARKIYTKEDDGLVQPWSGTVFMNPPFGRRNGHVPWLRKFLAHGDGIAIVRAYTSSAWFQQWAVKAQTMCFPRGKTKFIRPDGSVGRAPGHGIVLLGMGAVANKALKQSGLGFFVTVGNCDATVRCRRCPQLLEA